jgi:hypothetical protein
MDTFFARSTTEVTINREIKQRYTTRLTLHGPKYMTNQQFPRKSRNPHFHVIQKLTNWLTVKHLSVS